jgi:hypothetical protein
VDGGATLEGGATPTSLCSWCSELDGARNQLPLEWLTGQIYKLFCEVLREEVTAVEQVYLEPLELFLASQNEWAKGNDCYLRKRRRIRGSLSFTVSPEDSPTEPSGENLGLPRTVISENEQD